MPHFARWRIGRGVHPSLPAVVALSRDAATVTSPTILGEDMRRINVGIIGTGWCGGIRANACAANPLVDGLYIAEINPQRLAEVAAATNPRKATTEWRELLDIKEIDAIYISATPETTHYPMARDCLNAGKHVFLEKPIAMELREADELLDIARRKNLKFTIGYSQRFNPK